jgi:uncharacterized Zn-binding protein involved in type VI secretion
MRQRRKWLGVALALALGAVTARGQPPAPPRVPLPPQEALVAIHDLKLTRQARQALARDQVLAPLRLGVQVRQGVAVVWGDVPSDAVAQQAKDKLQAIDGIFGVRSELRPGKGAAREIAAADLSVPVRVPPRLKVEVAKPDDRTGTIKKRGTVVGGEGKKAARPGTLTVPAASRPLLESKAERAVVLQPPTARSGESKKEPPSRKGTLEEAVAKAKASQSRFRAIPVVVRGDVVVITRRGDEEDVVALAQILRRVRGVSEVRLSND